MTREVEAGGHRQSPEQDPLTLRSVWGRGQRKCLLDGAVWSDWCAGVFEACNIALSFELGCYPDPVTTLNPLDTEFLVI